MSWHPGEGKLLANQQAGVQGYWIVDYRARTVEVQVLKGGHTPSWQSTVDDLFEM